MGNPTITIGTLDEYVDYCRNRLTLAVTPVEECDFDKDGWADPALPEFVKAAVTAVTKMAADTAADQDWDPLLSYYDANGDLHEIVSMERIDDPDLLRRAAAHAVVSTVLLRQEMLHQGAMAAQALAKADRLEAK